jgi:hypothetical protein
LSPVSELAIAYYEQLADRIRALRARPLRFLFVTPA